MLSFRASLTSFFFLIKIQLVLAIIGFYASLVVIAKIWPSSKAPVSLVTVTSTETIADGAIPSADSAEFAEWLSKEGSFEKIFA
jgi:hypothetical protein